MLTSWMTDPRLRQLMLVLGGMLALAGLINVMPGYDFVPRLGPFAVEWFRPAFFSVCVAIAVVYGWRARLAAGQSIGIGRLLLDLALIVVTLYCSLRYFAVAREMMFSIVFFDGWDTSVALAAVAVATIICWRLWGAPIAIIGLLALSYLATGQYWPGVLQTAGGNVLDRLASNLWFGSDNGVLGSIFGIILSTVLPFIVLGAVLDGCGAGQSMIRISFALMQRFRGGPAYAAILASGLFGTVSGSAVANVVGTGVVTIPMIKKRGFHGDFAGGLESSASAGGQILPPIMGAAALVMADYVGVTYLTVILAVLIPALAYYASLFLAVYFEARKLGLTATEEADAEPVLRQDWINLLLIIAPLAMIVWLLVRGLSPAGASISAIFMLLPLSLLNPAIRRKPIRRRRRWRDSGALVDGHRCGWRDCRHPGGHRYSDNLRGTAVGCVQLFAAGGIINYCRWQYRPGHGHADLASLYRHYRGHGADLAGVRHEPADGAHVCVLLRCCFGDYPAGGDRRLRRRFYFRRHPHGDGDCQYAYLGGDVPDSLRLRLQPTDADRG